MNLRRICFLLGISMVVCALVVLASTLRGPSAGASGGIFVREVDADGGTWSSLALDSSGNPVVSYEGLPEFIFGDVELKLLHCDDPNCTPPGESITIPGFASYDAYSSLEIDATGNPVVSNGRSDLEIRHCSNPNCTGWVGACLDCIGTEVAYYTSLELDASGNPVVGYSAGYVKLAHCNDANCQGGNESVAYAGSGGSANVLGDHMSLKLDANGYPVISHYQSYNFVLGVTQDLGILHCNDANCTGGDETLTTPDTGGDVGQWNSLELDASGNPVVSYYDASGGNLKIMHCNDPNCSGGDESIVTRDSTGDVGQYTSLKLTADGRPIVSYYDGTNGGLKVALCSNANCSGSFSYIYYNPSTDVGQHTSLALDTNDNPVVSFYNATNDALLLLSCGATCTAKTPTPTPTRTFTPTPTATPTPTLTPTPTATPCPPEGCPPVGGVAELPEVAGTPLEAGGSGPSAGVLAVIAVGVTAGTVALGGAARYMRRRAGR